MICAVSIKFPFMERPMLRSTKLTAGVFLLSLAFITAPCLTTAQDAKGSHANPVIGTWKLQSFVREVLGTGERYNQLGEHPNGFIGYSPDGRMYVLIVAGDRVKPLGPSETDTERIQLYKSMIAYAGSYTIKGDKVIHHVDISWNGARAGTDQTRFFKVEGDTLTIKTAPNKSPIDGREGIGILVWERVLPSVAGQ
jgi:hypothetical protein